MKRQLLAGIVAGALVLAACGDDDSVTTETSPTDPGDGTGTDIALPTAEDAIVDKSAADRLITR